MNFTENISTMSVDIFKLAYVNVAGKKPVKASISSSDI